MRVRRRELLKGQPVGCSHHKHRAIGTLSGCQLCATLPAHHMQRLLLHIVHIHCQHGGAQVRADRGNSPASAMSHSSPSRYRCRINACDDANSGYYEPWLNFTIPQLNGIWEQCEHFQANSEIDASCVASAFNRSRRDRCEAGFIFRDIENTISTEVSSY